MERPDMVEQEFREEFKKVNDKLTGIQVAIAELKTKQGLAVWIINTLITVSLTVLTITFGGSFFKK